LIEAIAYDHATDLIDYGRRIMDRGREPLIVLQNLANVYRDLLIAKTASDRSDLVAMTSDGWQRLVQLAQGLAIPQILHGQQHLRSAELQIRNSTQPRLWLEITLMGLLPSAAIAPTQSYQAAIAPSPNINRPPTSPRPNNPLPLPSPAIAPPPVAAPANPTVAPASNPPTSSSAPIVNAEIPSLPETPLYTGDDDLEDFAAVGYDLEQVWQSVLAIMQPSTKALLIHTMKAFVMGIEHQTVRVCLAVERSNQIENHAKEKRNELEAAFSRFLQRTVKVAFRCDPHAVNTNSSSAVSPTPTPQNRTAIAPPPFTPNPNSTTASTNQNSQPSPPYSPQAASPSYPNHPPSNPVNTSQTHSPNPVFSPPSSEDMVIKNVADFFNGQIVDLEES
jgi:DNA polymerase-3 subunit gamma/tau